MLLHERNPHERDAEISFYEKEHIYDYHGEKFISVTTCINSLFEPFETEAVIQSILRSPSEKYQGKTCDEIRKTWEEQKTTSIEAGLTLHKDIEDYYNLQPNHENRSIEYEYFKNFLRDHAHLTPYRTEWKIYHEKYKIAGTIDMCYAENGFLHIYDWKRVRAIQKRNPYQKFSKHRLLRHLPDNNFTHYALQLNIYRYILQKKYKKMVKDMVLVILHPENKNQDYILHRVPDMTNEVKIILNDLKNQCSK